VSLWEKVISPLTGKGTSTPGCERKHKREISIEEKGSGYSNVVKSHTTKGSPLEKTEKAFAGQP